MADTFEVITQYPTVEFLGGSQTREVMAVGYRTKPSGIYLEVRIPRKIYSAAEVRNEGIGYAGTIEAIAALAGVEGITWVQTQRPDGTLLDSFDLYVSSSSGDSASSLRLPLSQMARVFAEPKINALRSQLDKAEAT